MSNLSRTTVKNLSGFQSKSLKKWSRSGSWILPKSDLCEQIRILIFQIRSRSSILWLEYHKNFNIFWCEHLMHAYDLHNYVFWQHYWKLFLFCKVLMYITHCSKLIPNLAKFCRAQLKKNPNLNFPLLTFLSTHEKPCLFDQSFQFSGVINDHTREPGDLVKIMHGFWRMEREDIILFF